MEDLRHHAERFQVPVERYEGIVLVIGEEHSLLLRNEEVKRLLIKPPAALVLMRLSTPEGMTSAASLSVRFFAWWHGLCGWWGATGQLWEKKVPIVEEPLWIRTERHQVR
ncbi:hypothetical protein ccbrp13_61610 [Ktedonobacteria bacterium brp13]|nr:hypothetical protein ccbrp13_61610 [Ktedonobacteria bacterium brp13]